MQIQNEHVGTLAVLLPISCRPRCDTSSHADGSSCEGRGINDHQHGLFRTLQDLVDSFDESPHVCVVVGIDEDDEEAARSLPAFRNCLERIQLLKFVQFGVKELRRRPPGAICYLWDRLAMEAEAAFCPEAFLLLGDDTSLLPVGWPEVVLRQFREHPHLLCSKLVDAKDPGFPSFPVIHRKHLELFGTLVPEAFINQGFDPFVDEVYRRVGATAMCPAVTITNHIGGPKVHHVEHHVEPRYVRQCLPHARLLQLVHGYSEEARRKLGRSVLTLDVAVPSYRVDLACLESICSLKTSYSDVDVRFVIVIDNPDCPEAVVKELRSWQLREGLLGRLRIRFHDRNLGASAARNRALDESLAEWVLFLDDDVQPAAAILDEYIHAIRANPDEAGFAGPTVLPKQPKLFPCAFLISDAGFFWDAPLRYPRVPWAVTANMLVRNAAVHFDLRYPKTGGGEDIDFCLRACPGGLHCVPKAVAVHPWWGGGRHHFKRFAMWAYGDAQLMEVFPRHTYRAAPNSTELLGLALVAAMLLALLRRPQAAVSLLRTAVVVKAADIVADVLRNCTLPTRLQQRPCPPSLRLIAVLEANLIKTWSEAGRFWSVVRRGRLALVTRRFDWFCSWLDISVQRKEQLRSLLSLALYIAAVLTCSLGTTWQQTMLLWLLLACCYRALLPMVE